MSFSTEFWIPQWFSTLETLITDYLCVCPIGVCAHVRINRCCCSEDSGCVVANSTGQRHCQQCNRSADSQVRKHIFTSHVHTNPLHFIFKVKVWVSLWFSIQTLVKISKTAGSRLKPHAPRLIPALLEALSVLEPQVLNYLSLRATEQEKVSSSVFIYCGMEKTRCKVVLFLWRFIQPEIFSKQHSIKQESNRINDLNFIK